MGILLGKEHFRTSRYMIPTYCLLSTVLIIHFFYQAQSGTFNNSIEDQQSQWPMSQTIHNIALDKTEFPRKIWQTSKTSVAGLDHNDRMAIMSWTKMNQKWRYEIITQYTAESYVWEKFRHRPDIIEAFTDLQDPILRADLVRYLVLLSDGGIYSDIDTKALKPIEDWIPFEYKSETNIVVGIEYDSLGGMRWVDWTLDLQFTTWSILAKPGHPLLELTIEKVINKLRRLATKQDRTLSELHPDHHEVLDTTGPALFTEAIFSYISHSTGTNFTHMNVTGLLSPKLFSDILILPITAFGNSQSHSNAGSEEEDEALVRHLFKGSWKGDHLMEHEAQLKKDEEEEEKKKKKEEEAEKQTKEIEENRKKLEEEKSKNAAEAQKEEDQKQEEQGQNKQESEEKIIDPKREDGNWEGELKLRKGSVN
ncbi:hypothetical protein MMC09_003758 [Bachmanniomyces sp. S44760]|nr:hypothetical protein [Bachmanniomyces sp. S44760]